MFGIGKARQEIYEFIATLTEEQAAYKPGEEQWSILDNLEHLYVIEQVMTADVAEILKSNCRNRAPRRKPLESTLERSKTYSAPEHMRPNHQFSNVAEAKEKLMSSRRSLLETLERYSLSDLTENSGKHPAFGTISVDQWIAFIGLHERRHLEQMKETLNRFLPKEDYS